MNLTREQIYEKIKVLKKLKAELKGTDEPTLMKRHKINAITDFLFSLHKEMNLDIAIDKIRQDAEKTSLYNALKKQED